MVNTYHEAPVQNPSKENPEDSKASLIERTYSCAFELPARLVMNIDRLIVINDWFTVIISKNQMTKES